MGPVLTEGLPPSVLLKHLPVAHPGLGAGAGAGRLGATRWLHLSKSPLRAMQLYLEEFLEGLLGPRGPLLKGEGVSPAAIWASRSRHTTTRGRHEPQGEPTDLPGTQVSAGGPSTSDPCGPCCP